jgi:hypothetical protein
MYRINNGYIFIEAGTEAELRKAVKVLTESTGGKVKVLTDENVPIPSTFGSEPPAREIHEADAEDPGLVQLRDFQQRYPQ